MFVWSSSELTLHDLELIRIIRLHDALVDRHAVRQEGSRARRVVRVGQEDETDRRVRVVRVRVGCRGDQP